MVIFTHTEHTPNRHKGEGHLYVNGSLDDRALFEFHVVAIFKESSRTDMGKAAMELMESGKTEVALSRGRLLILDVAKKYGTFSDRDEYEKYTLQGFMELIQKSAETLDMGRSMA